MWGDGDGMGSRLRGNKKGRGRHPHPRIKYGAGSNLPPSRRSLYNLSISPTATPITLTLILSQDGRGDKRDGYDVYAKVSIKGEGIR